MRGPSRRRRAARRILAVASSIGLLSGILAASATDVLASCNPGRTASAVTAWAGADSRNVSTVPVEMYAHIQEYQPFVHKSSDVYMWTMLARGSTQWAQIGWRTAQELEWQLRTMDVYSMDRRERPFLGVGLFRCD